MFPVCVIIGGGVAAVHVAFFILTQLSCFCCAECASGYSSQVPT